MMQINSRLIAPRLEPPYLIAEISANHCGDQMRCMALIQAAMLSGADAVKLQCYDPDTISADVFLPGWDRNARELYREAHTPREWFPGLFDCAKAAGYPLFASVFSEDDADFIQRFDPPAFKISSFDIVDTKLIEHVARFNKPIFISTGGAAATEVMAADLACGSCPHLFFHCVSEYPTPIASAHLGRIRAMQGYLRPPIVGLSDHSLGHDIAVAATALGVVAIEKHFTLARSDGGPDAAFSMEPSEYLAMAEMVRSVHAATFRGPSEADAKPSFYRKSLFYRRDIAAGERLSETDVRTMRPNLGIHPALLTAVVGRCARRDLAAHSPVSLDDFL